MPKSKTEYEDGLQKLQGIVDSLERGDLTLQETFQAYEEGRKLLDKLEKILQAGEKKIIRLEKEGIEVDITDDMPEARE